MAGDGTTTVVLTVATADWRDAIDQLEERCESIVNATMTQSASTPWLRGCEVSVLLAGDSEIRELNSRYRQRDRPTNVLSFPALDLDQGRSLSPRPPGHILLGDIALSFDRLSEEADARGKPLLDHFAHLLVHGTLHLLGYDHQEDEQAGIMEGIEESVLLSLDLAAPYDTQDDVRTSGTVP